MMGNIWKVVLSVICFVFAAIFIVLAGYIMAVHKAIEGYALIVPFIIFLAAGAEVITQ